MVLLDANVLIYAFCSGLPQYPAAKAWLAELLDSERRVGVSWLGIVAFVRIATNVRLAAAPLSMEAAMRYVGTLLAEPNVEVVEPGPIISAILRKPAVRPERPVIL
jgi:predicted nucleic acid-binding protein